MNPWQIVWNAYYRNATRRAYLSELWRIARWPVRVTFLVSVAIFLYGFWSVINQPSRDFPWALFGGEICLFALVEHVRAAQFATAYGSVESGLSPAEREDQRGHRFLMFKKALQERHLTTSHVQDLFEILQAKEELESHHNAWLNKYVIFLSGFLTSAAIALFHDLEALQLVWLIFWISLSGIAVAPLFWLIPTRRSRLKELKYFMVLYCRGDP